MERMGLDDDVAIESRLVSKTIENAQSRVEGYNFDIRKRVVEYDDVINKQRETIYAERDKVLRNEDLTETVRGFVDDEVDLLAEQHLGAGRRRVGPRGPRHGRCRRSGIDGRGHRAPTTSPRSATATTIVEALLDAADEARSRAQGTAVRRGGLGAWSSDWSCCAPSTSCGSTT